MGVFDRFKKPAVQAKAQASHGPVQTVRQQAIKQRVEPSIRKVVSSKDPYNKAMAYYDAASTGPRLGAWGLNDASTNGSLGAGLSALRRRADWLYENNNFAQKAIDKLTEYYVGTGATLRVRTANEEFNKSAEDLFYKWSSKCDIRGRTNFAGLQVLAIKSTLLGGDGFIRFRNRPLSDRLPVPLQLEIQAADMCPETFNTDLQNGNIVRLGVELDSLNRPVAYHMLSQNPRDAYGNFRNYDPTPVRVSSSELIHISDNIKCDTLRGSPAGVTSMVIVKELNEYLENERIRKRNSAMFPFVVTRPSPDGKTFLDDSPLEYDADGNPVGGGVENGTYSSLELEPGVIPILNPNEQISNVNTSDVGQSFTPFRNAALQEISAGYNIPIEVLTGDFSHINDRTFKAIMLDFEKSVKRWRETIIKPQFLNKVWERWLFMAVQSGALKIPAGLSYDDIYATWQFPSLGSVNPGLEIAYVKDAIRSGVMSRSAGCAYLGSDAIEVDFENSQDFARADNLGLKYDSDPRTMSLNGIAQPLDTVTEINQPISNNDSDSAQRNDDE